VSLPRAQISETIRENVFLSIAYAKQSLGVGLPVST
jgi:hypothetical protein